MLASGRIAGVRDHRRVVVGKAVWEPLISEDELRRILARIAAAKATAETRSARQSASHDYRRFHQPQPNLAVLLPYPPGPERLDLLNSADIEAAWPHGAGFRDSTQGRFV